MGGALPRPLHLHLPEPWGRGRQGALTAPPGRLLAPTHYCLRGDLGSAEQLRTWELQGSVDGRHWMTLSAHVDDSSVTRTMCGSWPLPIEAQRGAYAQFRILNQGPPHRLCCSGFELYGSVAGILRGGVSDAPPLRVVKTPAAPAAAPRSDRGSS